MSSLSFAVKNASKYAYSLIPLEWRLGKEFFQELNFLEKSQWWSKEELEQYQNEQLRKLVGHAYNNVPYYSRLFKDSKLSLSDIKTIKDLPKIPLLDKETVRNNLTRLKAINFKPSQMIKLNTSGTTGQPLIFYYDRRMRLRGFNSAFLWRHYGWAGHKVGERRATLSCWTIEENRNFIYNPINRLLVLSAYTLKQENAEKYADKMAGYKIKYLDGYPSSIELLTAFLKKRGMKNPPLQLRAIFCFAEYLNDWQRKNIESFWGCKCFDRYGLNERVIWGLECEKHEGLHLISEFGITEFLNDDSDKQFKRIAATSLTNYAMPFIRYETGDVGKPLEKKCSCCRNFPLFELGGGRKRNFAIGKDGSYIPVANIDIPSASDNVLQFQFVQDKKGMLTLSIIKKPEFRDKDLQKISNKLFEKFSNNMTVDIRFTDYVYKTNNQKIPIFIQKIEELK
jgi:phenylacetate-CoA ligase